MYSREIEIITDNISRLRLYKPGSRELLLSILVDGTDILISNYAHLPFVDVEFNLRELHRSHKNSRSYIHNLTDVDNAIFEFTDWLNHVPSPSDNNIASF